MLRLTLRQLPDVPLELDGILPETLAGLEDREVATRPIAYGNRTIELGEFFQVEGDASYGEMLIVGDCSRVKLIGSKMTAGRIVVDGPVGMHVGAQMNGGEIYVRGDVDDWLGAEMRGGTIRVEGNAANLVGANYRGSRRGMSGGQIYIQGHAGHEVGSRMRRGLIAVSGSIGEFAGGNMIAGTIMVLEHVGERLGAGMKRGTILVRQKLDLGPGFHYACEFQPAYLGLLWKHLHEQSCQISERISPAGVKCYRGDRLNGGHGEILVLA